jgi:hypothetical protein
MAETAFFQVENSFYTVNGTWRRRDPDGFGLWVARKGDMSPAVECHTNYLPGHVYDANCPYCWLGHEHSAEAHAQELREYAQRHIWELP